MPSLAIAGGSCVLGAVVIIISALSWGARNGTLRESRQESFDRRFAEIVALIGVDTRDASTF